MKDFNGKVAVVTGAASGIGRALADRCAREGMRVVLADVEAAALARTENELRANGAHVLAVRTDVSRLEDVQALADRTISAFGAVDLLCNNAGVVFPGQISELSIADWQWVLGVNLWGVIHGLHAFLPTMLAQDTPGHVVNTSSMAGFINGPGMAAYQASKQAVVSISETLYQELTLSNAKVGVSVLCPGFVKTNIFFADRNRPAELKGDPSTQRPDPVNLAADDRLGPMMEAGIDPSEIADQVFAAIQDNVFYILSTTQSQEPIVNRMNDILSGRNPTLVSI